MTLINEVAEHVLLKKNNFKHRLSCDDLDGESKLAFLRAAISDSEKDNKDYNFGNYDSRTEFLIYNPASILNSFILCLKHMSDKNLSNLGKKVIENAIEYIKIDIDKSLEEEFVKNSEKKRNLSIIFEEGKTSNG